jgi:hypothetical protein
MTTLKIISERVMKAGYVLRTEEYDPGCPTPDGKMPVWTMAYTPRGEYIGDPKIARRLCVKRGIQPELRTPNSRVCSVGFSVKDGKWYGWSHRAIFGFKIGSKCAPGHCHYKPLCCGGRGQWTARTVEDARQMACDFAEGVS